LASHFQGRPKTLRQVFDQIVKVGRSCGPVTVYAQKTRIVIQRRVRFAGAVVHHNWLDVGLWLKREASHPCLVRTESFGRLGFGHHFRLQNPDEIDKPLVEMIQEAYYIAQEGMRR
jgi:hypothetical protein